MLKNMLAAVIVFAVLLMLALTYVTARFVDREEILRAKTEMEGLRAARDSLHTVIAEKEAIQGTLKGQIDSLYLETGTLRDQVAELEEQRAGQQLSVRQIRTPEALQNRLEETYPELARSGWGVTDVDRDGISIQYLLVPLWFSETFIIDHQNSISYQQQRDTLRVVDELQQRVMALQDSVLVLEEQKSWAYKQGYEDAFARYEELHGKYIGLLEKPPQVKLGLPRWYTVLGSAAAGVVIGSQLPGR